MAHLWAATAATLRSQTAVLASHPPRVPLAPATPDAGCYPWYAGSAPKQASLFLRRVGYSAQLAILDVHNPRLSAGSPSHLRQPERYIPTRRLRSDRGRVLSIRQRGRTPCRSRRPRHMDYSTRRQAGSTLVSIVNLASGGLDSTLVSMLIHEEGLELHPPLLRLTDRERRTPNGQRANTSTQP